MSKAALKVRMDAPIITEEMPAMVKLHEGVLALHGAMKNHRIVWNDFILLRAIGAIKAIGVCCGCKCAACAHIYITYSKGHTAPPRTKHKACIGVHHIVVAITPNYPYLVIHSRYKIECSVVGCAKIDTSGCAAYCGRGIYCANIGYLV